MLKPIPRSEPVRIEGSSEIPPDRSSKKMAYLPYHQRLCRRGLRLRPAHQLLRKAVSEKRLIAAEQVPLDILDGHRAEVSCVIEHPRLPFVSYPYEWTFRMLKTAALFHLDFHSDALTEGITLVDASAYNVQFIGASPIFVDILSLRRYEPSSCGPATSSSATSFSIHCSCSPTLDCPTTPGIEEARRALPR